MHLRFLYTEDYYDSGQPNGLQSPSLDVYRIQTLPCGKLTQGNVVSVLVGSYRVVLLFRPSIQN